MLDHNMTLDDAQLALAQQNSTAGPVKTKARLALFDLRTCTGGGPGAAAGGHCCIPSTAPRL